jgi:uncharacterized membrane protein
MVLMLIAFFLFFPALILWLCNRFPFINKIGAVVICYVAGALVGNIGILPAGFDKVQNPMMLINICLALPLMFFSLDLKRWGRLAGKSLPSFGLQVISIIIISTAGHYIFRGYIGSETWKIAGMFIGVYTGGTVNLAAIATALQTNRTLFLAAHTSDTVIGAFYLLFLMTIGQRLFLKVLPPFKPVQNSIEEENFNYDSYAGIFSREKVIPLLYATGLTVIIFIAGGLSFLVFKEDVAFVVSILVITTLGIVCSFFPRIRNIKMTYQLGNYFILIFCLVVSSMANIDYLLSTAPVMLIYVTLTIFACLALHIALASLFKIDVDTVIITSVAGICSPPLVPMVALSLKNKEILITGIVTGIIGWMIGTYLGIAVAYIIHSLPF